MPLANLVTKVQQVEINVKTKRRKQNCYWLFIYQQYHLDLPILCLTKKAKPWWKYLYTTPHEAQESNNKTKTWIRAVSNKWKWPPLKDRRKKEGRCRLTGHDITHQQGRYSTQKIQKYCVCNILLWPSTSKRWIR